MTIALIAILAAIVYGIVVVTRMIREGDDEE